MLKNTRFSRNKVFTEQLKILRLDTKKDFALGKQNTNRRNIGAWDIYNKDAEV